MNMEQCIHDFVISQKPLSEEGFYYGVNVINKSLIMHNRLKGQNYNGLVLGASGPGKSFSAKRE